MKKLWVMVMAVAFLAGCGTQSVEVNSLRPMGEGNDGRIQQYLEEDVMASETGVCNFDWLHQPGGNVVEVWAVCSEYELGMTGNLVNMGGDFVSPVKITFANPTLHVVGEEGMSDIAKEKIANGEYDTEMLKEKNMERAEKWLLGEE